MKKNVFLIFMSLSLKCAFLKMIYADEVSIRPIVSFEFSTMAVSPFNFEQIFIQAKKDQPPVALSFNAYHRSETIEYEGVPELIFFTLKESEIPDSPPKLTPVASFIINSENYPEKILFFFHQIENDKNNSTRSFRVLAMNDTLDSFPPGKIIIFNPTDVILQGKVNGQISEFGFGPSKPFPLSTSTHTAFALETVIGPRIVFEGVFNYSENNRVILMLKPPRRRGSIRFSAHNIFERHDSTSSTKSH